MQCWAERDKKLIFFFLAPHVSRFKSTQVQTIQLSCRLRKTSMKSHVEGGNSLIQRSKR